MTSCSGLPICLSGIQIFPQDQRPMPQHLRPRMRGRARFPRDGSARICEAENSVSDWETTSTTAMVPMPSVDMLRENSCTREGSNYESYSRTPEWPRPALAQEMADLDWLREAIRRRGLQPRSYLMDYRLSSRQNDFLSACLDRQSMLDDQSDCTQKSICAKAA